MPGLIYAQDRQGAVYVNLYVSNETSFEVGRKDIALSIASEMPWGGATRIGVSAASDVRTAIKLRIPGWARNVVAPGGLYTYVDTLETPVKVAVNGTEVDAAPDALGYVSLDRVWTNGDTVEIAFPMPVRRVAADDRVRDDRRRVAIERGPIVYCAEWPDVEGGQALDLLLEARSELQTEVDTALYGGVTVVRTEARRVSNPTKAARPVTLIPYCLWANRGAGEMSVLLSNAAYEICDTGSAGGIIFYENPAFAVDGWRYLEAAPFDQSAGARWGCFRRQIAGAAGTAVGTGRQNTADMLAACSEPGTAAAVCASLNVNGVRGWFLPSRDELMLMYRNLGAAGLGNLQAAGVADNFSYWASSQQTADMATHIDFADQGRQHSDDKDFPRRVRAIRTI